MKLNHGMEFAHLADTGLAISRVGLGTWAIGGWMWGGTDDEELVRTIHAAIERGINLIDTAPAYGFGHSEEIVGRAIADHSLRSRVVIATKTGLEWKDGKRLPQCQPRRGSCARSTIRCGGLRPITSTSTRSIGPTRWCRSRRRPRRCRRF